MSPRFRPDPLAGHHERARELAAAGLIEPLSPEEAAWLEAHLASCTACRAVADEYEGQRLSLRMLRLDEPLPPRDLWARTAAALDAEAGVRRPSRRGWFGGFHVLPMAPLAAALVVAVIVGGTLLSGLELGTGGKVPVPTPIAATAGEVRLVTVREDGSLQISVGHYDGICPMGTEACANTASIEDRELGRQSPSSAVDALISPSGTSLVVVDRSSLLVYPVATPAVRPSASPEPATPSPAVTPEPATPSPSVAPSPTPSPSATASASASASPPASPSTSPDASVQPSASPSVEPSPSEPPSASPTLAPTPSPEVVVTPVPNGAIEIARDVIVVGTAADYSADGSLFAFAARPSDGTAGPDVYVWRTTERTAAAITTDHRSMFSSWLGDRLLVSRASADGDAYRPTTVIVDPSTGAEEPVAGSMFRPVVAPDGRSALWWDGTVEPTADGFGWQPRTGRLVLGAWSTDGATGDADLQVLADGASVRDWQVRWSKDGTVVALWVSDGTTDRVGTLSAYRVDAATGRVDTTDRLLADTPALQGFSLQGEQLVWAIPSQDGPTTIDVLAWSGDQVGHVRLLPDGTVTIVR